MEYIKILTFMVNNKKYGISIENIVMIEKNDRSITVLPQSNPLIRGVVNIRGKVCPVIDLKKHFNDQLTALEEDKKLILIEKGENFCALLVDNTDNIIDVSPSVIEEFELDEEKKQTKLVNLDGDIFILLEVERLDQLLAEK